MTCEGCGVMTALTIQNPKYEYKASKAIDDVLRKIFGDEGTLVIYGYMDKSYSIRQNEIVEKIDVFVDALRELLSSGAHPVEMNILENLYSSYGIAYKSEIESAETQLSFVNKIKFFSNN